MYKHLKLIDWVKNFFCESYLNPSYFSKNTKAKLAETILQLAYKVLSVLFNVFSTQYEEVFTQSFLIINQILNVFSWIDRYKLLIGITHPVIQMQRN